MTTLLLPERWAFAGVDLSSYATLVRQIVDVDSLPGLRGEDTPVPSRDGRYPGGKRFDSRRQALQLFVSSLPPDGVPVVADDTQARINLDALLAVLSRRSRGALVRTMPDGSTRTAMAEVVQASVPDYPVGTSAFMLVVDFLLSDPWYYGADVTADDTIAASPTDLVLAHPGTVDGSRLVLDFTGPLSNPRVANLSIDPAGGFYVEALVTVGAGLHLIVDVWAATALNDGLNAVGSIRHSGAFEWLRAQPGDNTMRVTATGVGGDASITLSPPYV